MADSWCNCGRYREELDDLMNEYDDKVEPLLGRLGEDDVSEFLSKIFNRNFQAGTDREPRCKAGKLIQQHPRSTSAVGAHNKPQVSAGEYDGMVELLKLEHPASTATPMDAFYEGLKILAVGRDKKAVPLLATHGVSGTGKTVFLRLLFNTVRTGHPNGAKALQCINAGPGTKFGKLSKIVTLFASYNQTSTVTDADAANPVPHLVGRFLQSTQSVSPEVYRPGTFQEQFDMSRLQTMDHFRELLKVGKETALVLCVDEILKLKNKSEAAYKTILDLLLCFSQTEMHENRFVAVVATSLSIVPIADQVLLDSGRALHVIPLSGETVNRDDLMNCATEFVLQSKTTDGTSPGQKLEIQDRVACAVQQSLSWSSLGRLHKALKDSRSNVTGTLTSPGATLDTAVVSAERLVKIVTRGETVAISKFSTDDYKLVAEVDAEVTVASDDTNLSIRAPPFRLFQYHSSLGELQNFPHQAMGPLVTLLLNSSTKDAEKNWETGLIAALVVNGFLKVKARVGDALASTVSFKEALTGRNSRLGRHFSSIQVDDLRFDPLRCPMNYPSKLAAADLVNPGVHHSSNPSEAGVEGVWTGLQYKGKDAAVFYQMKLWTEVGPADIEN